MSRCQCPGATALPTIPAQGCAVDFGQIQKIAFQRLHDAEGALNTFESLSAIQTKTSWTALIAKNDATKVAVTPFVEAPTAEGGDPITFGGGNDTLGGVETIIGRNPINMTFALRQYAQSTIKAMKSLMCEKDLGVFLFNAEGQILAKKVDEAYAPIPIQSLFVGDLVMGGLETPDANTLQFSFAPNYSDDTEVVTPSFNPLAEL